MRRLRTRAGAAVPPGPAVALPRPRPRRQTPRTHARPRNRPGEQRTKPGRGQRCLLLASPLASGAAPLYYLGLPAILVLLRLSPRQGGGEPHALGPARAYLAEKGLGLPSPSNRSLLLVRAPSLGSGGRDTVDLL